MDINIKLLPMASEIKPSEFKKYHPKIKIEPEKPKKHIEFKDPTVFDYYEDDCIGTNDDKDWEAYWLRKYYGYD